MVWYFVIIRPLTADPCASASRPLELVGRLKSHGVWVCVTNDERLVLFHLARAQEQMLFARMMGSHVLPTQDFQQPVKLDIRQVFDYTANIYVISGHPGWDGIMCWQIVCRSIVCPHSSKIFYLRFVCKSAQVFMFKDFITVDLMM